MIVFRNGKVYVDDLETTDPELIGYGILDFLENNDGKEIILAAVEPSRINRIPGFHGGVCDGCDGDFIMAGHD